MPIRKASAEWKGTLQDGTGAVKTETGAVDGAYSFSSRFEDGTGTNPEELVGAAYAACYSMALAGEIARAGGTPGSVATDVAVQILKDDPGFTIKKIDLTVTASAADLDDEAFQGAVQAAKAGCPLSKALAAVEEITVDAKLAS